MRLGLSANPPVPAHPSNSLHRFSSADPSPTVSAGLRGPRPGLGFNFALDLHVPSQSDYAVDLWVQDSNNTNLDATIESLLNVEKKMRLAGDVAGTRKAAIDIVELCFKADAWKTLNDQIVFSKRRGQLKQFVGNKVAYALAQGLNVIACVGETLESSRSWINHGGSCCTKESNY